MVWSLLCVLGAAAGVALALPPRPRPPLAGRAAPHAAAERSWRTPAVALAAGVGGWVVVGGAVGVATGVLVSVASWRVLARAEPAVVRREREEVARDLPHLVDLFAVTLHAGAEPLDGLERACAALPGAAARRLVPVLDRARLGAAPAQTWAAVADDEALASLGRTMARSLRTGASVVESVEQLADELERGLAAAAEDRAHRVGVLAAVPLGVCLLPAFLLIGIVPTVAGLFAELAVG